MRIFYAPTGLMMVLAVLVFLSGCAGQSGPTNFYMMEAGEQASPDYTYKAGSGGPLVGVGPVEIPAYLDRPQIVTRKGGNVVNLAEFDNWAEPLGDTFSRLTMGMLVTQLAPQGVGILPWQGQVEMDYQVTLSVIRLDNDTKGNAVLSVRWTIFTADRQLLTTQISNYRSQYTALDLESFAAAQSQNLDRLCKDIAEAIKQQAMAS